MSNTHFIPVAILFFHIGTLSSYSVMLGRTRDQANHEKFQQLPNNALTGAAPGLCSTRGHVKCPYRTTPYCLTRQLQYQTQLFHRQSIGLWEHVEGRRRRCFSLHEPDGHAAPCTVSKLLPHGICFFDHLPGPLPRWLGQLTNLQRLQLDENHIHGAFPQSMKHLGDLEVHTEERRQEGKRKRRERLLEDNDWA